MNNASVFNWLEIFKSPMAKTVEIHPANGHLSDGILRYRCTGKCAAIELKRELLNDSGSQRLAMTILLEGNGSDVLPGDKIVYNGETFELAKVELCRSVSGEIIARRCTVR